MAIAYSISKWPACFPSRVLARDGGKHIYNITLSEDLPNAVFISKGAFQELDRYAEAAAGSVTGKIQGKAPNGNFWVEISTCDEGTCLVYNVPVIDETFTKSFTKEENYYNKSGSTVRAYQLAPGDIIEMNAAALGLSADPVSYPVNVSAATYGTSTYAKALN